MWYRISQFNKKPGVLPQLNKLKKRQKTKRFDSGVDEVDVKMPQNTTETPDLPAGVDKPPVTLPAPEPQLAPEPDLKPEPKDLPVEIKKPTEEPDELKKLYDPDKDIKDDKIVHMPKEPEGLDDLLDDFLDKDPDKLEQPEESELEEPEPEQLEEPEVEPREVDLQQPVPNPPIHEFCHCEIITMPGGRKIWRANSGACAQCLDARDKFNQWQSDLFGT